MILFFLCCWYEICCISNVGEEVMCIIYSCEYQCEYWCKVWLCLDVFEIMFVQIRFEVDWLFIGMEIECNFVDVDYQLVMLNCYVLDVIVDLVYQIELGVYNIEFNVLFCLLLGCICLELEDEVCVSFNDVEIKVSCSGVYIVMIGILFILMLEYLIDGWMSVLVCYVVFNELIFKVCGEDIFINIVGLELLSCYVGFIVFEFVCISV